MFLMRNKNAKIPEFNKFVTNPGDTEQIQYASKVLPDGTVDLVESGRIDINAMINAQRDSTDIAYILQKMKETGDISALAKVEGVYGDFTEFPKTYAEILQLRIDSENSFYALDPDVRSKFDNDFNKYFASAGTEEWFSKLGINTKVDEPKVESEVSVE